MYFSSPDYRGERYISRNPAWKNASLTRRYNAMMQILHRKVTGDENASLSREDLKNKRYLLKKQANYVFDMIEQEKPGVTHWSDLSEMEKMYYAMILEEKAAEICKIDIFHCERQWCARRLLGEAFKMKLQARTRKARRAEDSSSMPNKIRRVSLFTTKV